MKEDLELRKWVAGCVKDAIEKGYFHTEDDEKAMKILSEMLNEKIREIENR